MTTRASSPGPDGVLVWHAHTRDLFPNEASRTRARSLLSAADRQRDDAYRHETDRLMFVGGRVMARTLVGRALGVAPDEWRWRDGPRGRPEVAAPATTLTFNLAHSAGLVVCALADGREVGADVEDRLRRPVDRLVVPRYCAPDEARDIDAQGDAGWHDRFLRYWTLKEAYLKARGLGIALPLAEISFALDAGTPRVTFIKSLAGTDERWAFHLAEPTTQHVLAVAASCPDGRRPSFVVAPFEPDAR
ncbi:MAG TPA: 4'-phosphopantetheinyl transferase superfamily protein [Vicinamibacterales bacterium]|nr:4'-phosphopantetheinyl transferase superfamily protein [Vicinamibacterales bacterium]